MDEARDIIYQYSSTQTFGLYNQALLDHVSGLKGDFELHAAAAYQANSWLAKYLSGERKLPKASIKDLHYDVGTAKEAQWYLWGPGRVWKEFPAAIKDLEPIIKTQKEKKPTKKRATKKNRESNNVLLAERDILQFRDDLLLADLSKKETLLRLLSKWGRKIFDLEPWNLYGEFPSYIDLGMGGRDEICAHFSGGLGTIRGCNVYRSGRDHFSFMKEIDNEMNPEISRESRNIRHSVLAWAAQSLTISLEPSISVGKGERQEIERALGRPLGKDMIYTSSKVRGHEPGACDNKELFDALLGLYALTYLMSIPFDTDIPPLVVRLKKDEELQQHLLSFSKLTLGPKNELHEAVSNSSIKKLQKDLSQAIPIDTSWQIGFSGIVGAVKPLPGKAPTLVNAAIVIEPNQGCVVGTEMAVGNVSPIKAMVRALRAATRSTRQRPKRLELHESILSDEIVEHLSELDIPLIIELNPSMLIMAASAMSEALQERGKPARH